VEKVGGVGGGQQQQQQQQQQQAAATTGGWGWCGRMTGALCALMMSAMHA
jgi:hypothetical protein